MSPTTPSADEDAVRELARTLLRSWNARDAAQFAGRFTEDGVVVGYDGTVVEGRAQIIVAFKLDVVWRAASVQTTPAALHGRPDQVKQMTAELQRALGEQTPR